MSNVLILLGFLGTIAFLATGLYHAIRRTGKAKRMFGIAGAAFVLLIIGAATSPGGKKGFEEGKRAATDSSTPASAPAPTTQPAANPYGYSATVDGKKYLGKFASNVGAAVIKVQTAQTVGSDAFSQKAEGKFVLIEAAITNGQKDQITVDSNSFKILANGKEYSGSTEGMTALLATDYKTFFLKGLNPDVTSVGWLVFDVPKDLDLGSAVLQFSGGFTGKTDTLPLKPVTQ